MPPAKPTNLNVFDPPSADQLAKHLAQHPAVNIAAWQQRGPWLMMIAVAGLALLMIGQPGLAMLPLVGLLALGAYLSGQARLAAELQAKTNRAWELAMIRRYREALGQAWELLPRCRTKPELHGRAVTVIAHILGELGQHDAADIAYTHLLDRLPPRHPLALRLQLQRATAALANGRLADGDDALRKLRGPVDTSKAPAARAAYRLAKLVQDVHTGHYADAIHDASETAKALKPLGVEAGYGYALLAFCCAHRDQHPKQAKHYWDQATLLIPPAALVYRYPELKPLLNHDWLTSTQNGSA